jgi:hypothetical protein
LKFRGLARSKRNLSRATDSALASCVAATSESPELERFPSMTFGDQADRIMASFTAKPEALLAPKEVLSGPARYEISPIFFSASPATTAKN